MPRITEADLKKQIKNKSFSPVYLIYGSEQMFVKSYTKKLCEAVAGKNPSDFNYHTFSGDIDFQELAASLQIMPFMAERNCVVVFNIFVWTHGLVSMSGDKKQLSFKKLVLNPGLI